MVDRVQSRAALFSLANGQVTATPSAGFLRESLSLRPRAVAVSKQWGSGCGVDASSALCPLPCAVGLTGERQPGAPRIDRARADGRGGGGTWRGVSYSMTR